MNGVGIVKEPSRSVTPSSYLGKRKRSASPEKAQLNGSVGHGTQPATDSNIDNIVREIKQYSVAPSLLEHPLPKPDADGHSIKKQKTDGQGDTVEGRLAQGYYASPGGLISDVRQVLAAMKKTGPQVNGLDAKTEASEWDKIQLLLQGYDKPTDQEPRSEQAPVTSTAGQVLTVRSNVDGGQARQLFTGLRIRRTSTEDIDVRTLPSGFDIVEAALMDTAQQQPAQDTRTFGQVFRQVRNQRQLELPRPSRAAQSTTLTFEKPFENSTPQNREDYTYASLSAGSWLDYSTATSDPAFIFRSPSAPTRQDPEALFKASFSSFAPTEDNALATVPSSQRARRWFWKYGAQALTKVFPLQAASPPSDSSVYPEIDDDFQELIDNFEAVPPEELSLQDKANQEEKEILDEISELLQTLSSYQQIRDLDRNRVHNVPPQLSAPETETYELLRQQLQLLVNALPPFAVSKLDGDQLKELSISTNILVRTPDIAGTGQPDEGTLARQRHAQAQQAAMARPINQQPARNSYTGNAAATPYASQPRSFGANQTPSLPGYAQRNAQMYSTPRANVQGPANQYSQTPYQRSQQPYPGATIQQYQRMQNGYGQNVQTPFQQRTGHAQYPAQNQMQNNMQYGRSSSPTKPMVNGQNYGTPNSQQYQSRSQHPPMTPSTTILQGPYAQANAHATIQQIKAAQQGGTSQPSQSQSPQPQPMHGVQQTNTAVVQTQQQRQASGTPQPPSQSQTPQQQQATMAAVAVASAAGLNKVPGPIGQVMQANSQQPPSQRVAAVPTPTPTPVATGTGSS